MNQLDHSEGDMVDIQSEECINSDSLMWIDSSSGWEDIFTICGFTTILVLTILTGTLGPPAVNWQKSDRLFNDKPYQRFHFDAAPISSYNRFIKFDFSYIRENMNVTLNATPAPFVYQVNCQDKTGNVMKINKTVNFDAIASIGQKETEVLHLFNDKFIDYQAIELVVLITKPDLKVFKGISVKTSLGTHDHTTYQCYFRFVYTCFELVSLYMLYSRIKLVSYNGWHFEQKILFPIILFAIFANNPLYLFFANHPSKYYGFYDAVAHSCFEGFFTFAILSLFDFLKKKNHKTNMGFFIGKIAVGILIFIAKFINELYDATLAFQEQNLFENALKKGLMYFEIAAESVFVIWLFIIIIQSGIAVDTTEKNRFIMFLFSGIVILFSYGGIDIICRIMNYNADNAVNWICTFVSKNVFILMMIYFHWPFEIQTDQTYVDGVDGKLQPTEFFVNADHGQDLVDELDNGIEPA